MKLTIRHLLLLLISASLSLSALAQPTLESLGRPGPYQVAYYDQLPPVDEYSGATLYFPANRGTEFFGGVAISPGFIEIQENIAWWGNHLASHGFAVLILDTNTPRDNPQLRSEALLAALEVLRGEGQRPGSPIRGKIVDEQMAVMGHSMGGGGALLAANSDGARLKAAIPFTPWLPDGDFANVAVPTLVLAGEIDRIAAVADHAWPHYQSLPDGIPRMYVEVAGGNHFIANSVTENEGLRPNIDVHDLVGALGVAWLKYFVSGDEQYRDIIYGELPAGQRARLSRFEFAE